MGQRFVERKIRANVFDFEELSLFSKDLFKSAAEARKNAQAPYSNYYVGVAIYGESGKLYSGCNVERVSWTQTTHAEQNAVDSMVAAEGPSKIRALALVAAPKNEEVILQPKVVSATQVTLEEIGVPCGHCLQIIWENCFNDPWVSLMSLMANGKISLVNIGDALPFRFGPADLGVDYSKLGKKI